MRNRLKEYPIGCKSDDGRLYDPVTLGVLAAATIGTSLYSANEQKKAAKNAANMQEQQALEARRIAAEQKPMEEAAKLQTDTGGSVLGNLGLSVEADYSKKKTSALGGTSSPVGLGFGI